MFNVDTSIFDNDRSPINNLDDLAPEEIIPVVEPDEITFPEMHWDNKPLERSVDLIQFDGSISKQEMDFVRDYLKNKITMNLEDALPDTLDDETIIQYVKSFGKVYSAVNKASDILQPIVGRLMVLMEKRPEIIKYFGVSSISQFATQVAPKMFRVARCDAYDARKIATGFPTLTPDQYATLGRSNLKAIGKLGEWNPKAPVIKHYTQVIANNPSITYNELINRMAEDGHDTSHLLMTRIDMRVTQSERMAWKEFIEDPDIQAYCQTKNEVQIFFAMIAECYSQWKAMTKQRQQQDLIDSYEPESQLLKE